MPRQSTPVPSHWGLPERLAYCSESVDSGCREWTRPLSSEGYGNLWWEGKMRGAHVLAWEVGHGTPRPPGMFVCHRCDNPKCIKLEHLFLGTPSDNSRDREEKGRGRHAKGEANGKAKLTAEIVLQIRSSTESMGKLAKKYGVCKASIQDIKSRKNWAHI